MFRQSYSLSLTSLPAIRTFNALQRLEVVRSRLCSSYDVFCSYYTLLPIRFIASFATFAPKLYRYYEDNLSKLFRHKKTSKTCRRPFKRSVFTAATFNLGPRCFCKGHCDSMNVPQGWCMVCCFGKFDPTKGGHLVLEEFNLVVEFPPGSVVLIPSSVVRHGNTPIGEGETRSSFTQYVSGHLLRFVLHGFRKESRLSKREHAQFYGDINVRWEEALNMYSKLAELPTDVACLVSEPRH